MWKKAKTKTLRWGFYRDLLGGAVYNLYLRGWWVLSFHLDVHNPYLTINLGKRSVSWLWVNRRLEYLGHGTGCTDRHYRGHVTHFSEMVGFDERPVALTDTDWRKMLVAFKLPQDVAEAPGESASMSSFRVADKELKGKVRR